MKHALTLTCMLLAIMAHAQEDLKQLKKEIPVKGIKSVEQTEFSPAIYWYRSKKDTGLWDSESKTVILQHVKKAEAISFHNSWFQYSTSKEHGVYNLDSGKVLVSSSQPFQVAFAMDTNFLTVVGSELFGYLDRKKNNSYCAHPSSESDSTFFDDGWDGHKCYYNAKDKRISYGYGDYDGFEHFNELFHIAGYVAETGGSSNRLYDAQTGKQLMNYNGRIYIKREFIIIDGYRSRDYYDMDLNLIYEDLTYDDMELEHMQFFFDSTITSSSQVREGIFLCKAGNKRRFYSVHSLEPISAEHDHNFPIGYDFLHGGDSYFTVNETTGYGLFNTWRGDELEPKYSIIEKRIFPDGSYWYRADDMLYKAREWNTDTLIQKKWDPAMEKTSIILFHLSFKDNKLIISPRSTSSDTHDSGYYTATNFEDGAGVINLKDSSWIIKPRYHTITPYKGHYVAMKIGSTYPNASWLQTTIFDKDLKPITDKKFGCSFIYNGMLFLRDGISDKLVEYDVEQNKVVRTLGTVNEIDADFKLVDGYLIIGDYNYRGHGKRNGELKGMDISDIITPDGKLVKVPVKRFRYGQMLGEDLVTVKRIRQGEPTDRDLHRLKTDLTAIYDLRSGRLISPWCQRADYYEGEDFIYFREKKEDEQVQLPINEIRKKFK